MEEICNKEKNDKKDEENIKFLLDCGAEKEEVLKEAIEQSHFNSFKKLMEENKILLKEIKVGNTEHLKPITVTTLNEILFKKIKNSIWNKTNILEKRINKWLEEKSIQKDEESIKFLFKCEADKNIIYEQIKIAIKLSNYENFKFFIEKFKETISLEEIKKEEWTEKIQNQLNKWLMYYRLIKEDRDFLLKCGANENILKGIDDSYVLNSYYSYLYLDD